MADFLKERDNGLRIFPNTNSYLQKEFSKCLLMIDGAWETWNVCSWKQ